MKKRQRHLARLGTVVVVAVLLLSSVGAFLYARPVPALGVKIVQTSQDKTTAVSLPWPPYGESAIGSKSFGVIATHGQQVPHPTASVAKIMTVLAILQKKPLKPGEQGPTITLTQKDQDIYDYYFSHDGSLAAMKVGERITEYQALEAILLPSANNFADSLAIWAFGSISAYSTYANSLAKGYGLANSNFTSASGFAPTTVSTAQDLVRLGTIALQNPVIAEIVAKPSATIPVAGKIYNVNGLLGKDGINGIKTGNTDQAGGVFMTSSSVTLPNKKTINLVAVVMGAPTLVKSMQDSLPIVEAAKDDFVVKTPVQAGKSYGVYTTPWDAKTVRAVAAKDVSIVTWSNTTVKTSVTLDKINGSRPAGSEVGKLTVTAGSQSVTVLLKLEQSLTSPTAWWRLTHR